MQSEGIVNLEMSQHVYMSFMLKMLWCPLKSSFGITDDDGSTSCPKLGVCRFGPGATRQSAEWKGYGHRQKCRQTPRTSQMGGRQRADSSLTAWKADRESHVVPPSEERDL